MSKFSEQVHITIDEFTQTVVYYDLKLSQAMMDHHHFSFVWQYTGKAVIKPSDQAEALRKYKGREVIFTFKSINGSIRLMSKGIITQLESVDVNGSPVGLYVKGTSHTILLQDQKKSRTFLDRSLQEIAISIFSEETAGEFFQVDAIKPTNTAYFDYTTQYNETSFDFLKRLSARYGQWFYFDGMRMQFGQTKTSKVKLINGSSLHDFRIQTNLVSHKTSFAGYDYKNASNIRASELKTSFGSTDSFARIVGDRQASVSQPALGIAAYTNQAGNLTELTEMVKLQTAGRDANSVFYSGVSYYPIGLGQVFTIQNQTVEHELIAIEVIHHSKVHGNYSCEFKAIPADVAAPHYTNVEKFRKAKSQSAIVTENNDPEALGRVKVEFYWGSGGRESEWMRVTQQYSGSGRGSYCRPEIGDEVLIDFEGGNVDCPYVSASHYNGNATPEFFDPNNMIKAIRMRFGQLLKFIEKVSITLSDPSGNEIHLDEENKNMTLTTRGTLTLNCSNLILNVTENMTTNVIINKKEIIGANYTENVVGQKVIGIGGDLQTIVDGKYKEHIKGNLESHTEKDRTIMSKEKFFIQSIEDDVHVKASNNLNNHSGENTKTN